MAHSGVNDALNALDTIRSQSGNGGTPAQGGEAVQEHAPMVQNGGQPARAPNELQLNPSMNHNVGTTMSSPPRMNPQPGGDVHGQQFNSSVAGYRAPVQQGSSGMLPGMASIGGANNVRASQPMGGVNSSVRTSAQQLV
jgi:hypothetical protein